MFLSAGLLGTIALASPGLADDQVVKVGHNRLDRAELSVEVGTEISFLNEDEMPGGHTIVAEDGSFESPELAEGKSRSHVFEEPGVSSYSIKEHPFGERAGLSSSSGRARSLAGARR